MLLTVSLVSLQCRLQFIHSSKELNYQIVDSHGKLEVSDALHVLQLSTKDFIVYLQSVVRSKNSLGQKQLSERYMQYLDKVMDDKKMLRVAEQLSMMTYLKNYSLIDRKVPEDALLELEEEVNDMLMKMADKRLGEAI